MWRIAELTVEVVGVGQALDELQLKDKACLLIHTSLSLITAGKDTRRHHEWLMPGSYTMYSGLKSNGQHPSVGVLAEHRCTATSTSGLAAYFDSFSEPSAI
jgi:hypothetical protein